MHSEEISNEGMFSNPLALLENPILFENPLSQGAKVGIAVGVVAVLGIGAYFLLKPSAAAAPSPIPTAPPPSSGQNNGGLPASHSSGDTNYQPSSAPTYNPSTDTWTCNDGTVVSDPTQCTG